MYLYIKSIYYLLRQQFQILNSNIPQNFIISLHTLWTNNKTKMEHLISCKSDDIFSFTLHNIDKKAKLSVASIDYWFLSYLH